MIYLREERGGKRAKKKGGGGTVTAFLDLDRKREGKREKLVVHRGKGGREEKLTIRKKWCLTVLRWEGRKMYITTTLQCKREKGGGVDQRKRGVSLIPF